MTTGLLGDLLGSWAGTTLAVLGVAAAIVVIWVGLTLVRTPEDGAGRPLATVISLPSRDESTDATADGIDDGTDGPTYGELLRELVDAAPYGIADTDQWPAA
jgi:hypothetical protein